MPTYKVRWEIDIEADSPEAAAHEALAIQRDPESIATAFDVDGQVVDLDDYDDYDVYELIVPGLGLLWLTLNADDAATVQTYVDDLGGGGGTTFGEIGGVTPVTAGAGIDYDSREPGQMDALLAILEKLTED